VGTAEFGGATTLYGKKAEKEWRTYSRDSHVPLYRVGNKSTQLHVELRMITRGNGQEGRAGGEIQNMGKDKNGGLSTKLSGF
jgi:hypothetical protein